MKNDIKLPKQKYVDNLAIRHEEKTSLLRISGWLLAILILGSLVYNVKGCSGDYEGQSQADGAVCTQKIGSIVVDKITN